MMQESRERTMFAQTNSISRSKFGALLHSDPLINSSSNNNDDDDDQYSNTSSTAPSPGPYYEDRNRFMVENSPYNNNNMSPWNQPYSSSPFNKSPWFQSMPVVPINDYQDGSSPTHSLIGSLVREEGHIYSLAAIDDLLYTGSDSKNIRVWKNQKEFTGFKSNSGLVKAIIISGKQIFTGHQDGKIRVWKVSDKNPKIHKRIGTLPKLKDFLKSSINPSNYVEVRRNRNAIWIKHFDAISCLSLSEDQTLLYSGSWDKTLKVWRVSDFKCLESINVHDDAVNSVVTGFDGMVFTGSADGTVKVWRRELQGKGTKHFFIRTLLKQECAVTALAVNSTSTVIYCGSSDGVVNFWERASQLSELGFLKGHKLAVLCLTTAGNLVFSGSADKTICVWLRENGIHTCLSILNGHSGPVKCLTVENDSKSTVDDQRWILYSGSLDKSVKVWRVKEQAPDFYQVQHQQYHQENLMNGGSFSSPSDSMSSTTNSFSSSTNIARY